MLIAMLMRNEMQWFGWQIVESASWHLEKHKPVFKLKQGLDKRLSESMSSSCLRVITLEYENESFLKHFVHFYFNALNAIAALVFLNLEGTFIDQFRGPSISILAQMAKMQVDESNTFHEDQPARK